MLSLSLPIACYLAVALSAILYEYNHGTLPRSRQLALAVSLLMLTGMASGLCVFGDSCQRLCP